MVPLGCALPAELAHQFQRVQQRRDERPVVRVQARGSRVNFLQRMRRDGQGAARRQPLIDGFRRNADVVPSA